MPHVYDIVSITSGMLMTTKRNLISDLYVVYSFFFLFVISSPFIVHPIILFTILFASINMTHRIQPHSSLICLTVRIPAISDPSFFGVYSSQLMFRCVQNWIVFMTHTSVMIGLNTPFDCFPICNEIIGKLCFKLWWSMYKCILLYVQAI